MGLDYEPDKDIPDLSGKVILITGGTGGIGENTILELVKHNPAHIYFTGRNKTTAAELVTKCSSSGISVTFMYCEMDSLESVRAAADEFRHDRLDLFISNAGVMAIPAGLTKDGYEVQFGVNHVGGAALLLRLLPVMLRTAREVPDADVRFVTLTSMAYRGRPANGIDFDTLRTTQENLFMGSWIRYAQSKLANMLMARELGKRYPMITTVAIHPGVVDTDLIGNMTFIKRLFIYVTNPVGRLSPREGCFSTLWAATSPDVKDKLDAKIPFFLPIGEPHLGDAKCVDDELAKELWDWTVKEVGIDVEEIN